ncbi:MAG: arginine--tRNA ligase [Clostridia bacterium]|nr:arginine--tRNA ligase [Clostridia bacterium]
MEEIKQKIAECIVKALTEKLESGQTNVTIEELRDCLEIPKDPCNGDYAFPCFKLAKVLKDSPANIACKISSSIETTEEICKIEPVSGYLNFFVSSENISETVMNKILSEKESYGSSDEGSGKNVVVDYSSPNIAKPFHLGHLRTTIIGHAISNLYKELGYNLTKINYLGDWGRQFGLLIEGYNRFKDEYDIEKDALHILSDIYVRINKLAKEDESIMDKARENFKKLEDGDKDYLALWQYFRDISLKEYNRIYEILGCEFDSYNGEAFYNDKMDEVIDILDKKGVLVESEGAKVVKLGENEPPCIIVKSNGSTIYATRDLAAVLYRARTYDFYKAIYVTSYEQIHHFKQIFEVSKNLVDKKYSDGLIHVPYGMVRLKTGKMSTREGTVIYLQDLISDSIMKAERIIEEKNPNIENRALIAKQVGVGAIIFNDLKHNKIKDIVFDLDEVLRFDGETGPYVQYTYVRTQSILKKAGFNIDEININDINLKLLYEASEIDLIKELSNFEEIIKKAAESYEPSVLTRYIIEVASLFSKFYNDYPVITENVELKQARCALVYATGLVIKKGLSILGIECPEKM